MNEYWKQQHGLTTDEKRAFVERTLADEARFQQSLRKITDGADNRMRERTAKQQHAEALRELNRGPDDVVPDADDSGEILAGTCRGGAGPGCRGRARRVQQVGGLSMNTSHWAQQLGLRQTDTGELVAILDPAESRARSRRAREKSVFVPPAPKPAPDEVEDADDSSARRAACPT